MAKFKSDGNPFRPGTATEPAYLAGRHKERKLIEKTLVGIAELHGLRQEGSPYRSPHAPIKIVGPRGVGKTTLLAEAEIMAEEMGIYVLSIEQLPDLVHREMLTSLIGEKAYDRLKAHISRVKGVSVASVGVDLAPGDIDLPRAFRKKMEKQPLLLLMDEVMHYEPKALAEILQMCQRLIRGKNPLAVIMAGTPMLDPLLARVFASFIDRSKDIYINTLSDNETLEALSKPFELEEIQVKKAALRYMVKLTDNYPFFTQIVGEHVWDALPETGKREVSLAMVQAAEPEIQKSRVMFYKKIRAKMVDANLMKHAGLAMEILGKNKGKALRDVIISGLGNTAIDTFEEKYVGIFHELLDHGFIWEQEDLVEAGIPSFFDYCQQKAKEAARSNRS